jgi:hypothetical protein
LTPCAARPTSLRLQADQPASTRRAHSRPVSNRISTMSKTSKRRLPGDELAERIAAERILEHLLRLEDGAQACAAGVTSEVTAPGARRASPIPPGALAGTRAASR